MRKVLPVLILILWFALFLLALKAAHADGYINTPSGNYMFGTFTPFAPAKIIHAPPMSEAAQDHDRRWLAACNPKFRRGQYGVTYYDFSASPEGCEYGYIPQ